jgi:hypothetical protein
MQRAAIIALLAVKVAAIRNERGSAFLSMKSDMQPGVVAHSLVKVEDEWTAQSQMFAECNATATTGAELEECAAAPRAFEKACSTVMNAVVQGSNGAKEDVAEYMNTVCSEDVLKGWRAGSCQNLATAMISGMSDDAYDNRERFESSKLCKKFWTQFSNAEIKRVAAEKAEEAEQEKKAAEEHAAEEKKEAEDRAEAEKKATEEAAAEEKKKAEEEATKAAEEAQKAEEEKAAKDAKAKAEAQRLNDLAEQRLAEADIKLAAPIANSTSASNATVAAVVVAQANATNATNATKTA